MLVKHSSSSGACLSKSGGSSQRESSKRTDHPAATNKDGCLSTAHLLRVKASFRDNFVAVVPTQFQSRCGTCSPWALAEFQALSGSTAAAAATWKKDVKVGNRGVPPIPTGVLF